MTDKNRPSPPSALLPFLAKRETHGMWSHRLSSLSKLVPSSSGISTSMELAFLSRDRMSDRLTRIWPCPTDSVMDWMARRASSGRFRPPPPLPQPPEGDENRAATARLAVAEASCEVR